MSSIDLSQINDSMDSDKTGEASGLRRSKRRNKFHLDVAAMLTGNNPDRRLSPQPQSQSVHQTASDNQTFLLSSKRANSPRVPKAKTKSSTSKLSVLQSVKPSSVCVGSVLDETDIIKNISSNLSYLNKSAATLHNVSKPKSSTICTSMTRNCSKSPNLRIVSNVADSLNSNNTKLCNNSSVPFLAVSIPAVSAFNTLTTTLNQNLSESLINANEKSATKPDETNKNIAQIPTCSTSAIQKLTYIDPNETVKNYLQSTQVKMNFIALQKFY